MKRLMILMLALLPSLASGEEPKEKTQFHHYFDNTKGKRFYLKQDPSYFLSISEYIADHGVSKKNITIIYNHGLQSTKEWFNETALALRWKGYNIVSYDRIGSGMTSRRLGKGHVDDYNQFFKSLDIIVADIKRKRPDDKIVLWGNSYGAKVVTGYLFRTQYKIHGAVYTTPGLYSGMKLPFSKLDLLFSSNQKKFPIPMTEITKGDNGGPWFTSQKKYLDLIANDPYQNREVTRSFYMQTRNLDRYISGNDNPHKPCWGTLANVARLYMVVEKDPMMDNATMKKHYDRNNCVSFRKPVSQWKEFQGGKDNKHFLTFTSDRDKVIEAVDDFLLRNVWIKDD